MKVYVSLERLASNSFDINVCVPELRDLKKKKSGEIYDIILDAYWAGRRFYELLCGGLISNVNLRASLTDDAEFIGDYDNIYCFELINAIQEFVLRKIKEG